MFFKYKKVNEPRLLFFCLYVNIMVPFSLKEETRENRCFSFLGLVGIQFYRAKTVFMCVLIFKFVFNHSLKIMNLI